MKIKEVIAVTGLTDRAIRLYIEHGLLFPDTKESYSGRRNIDFSDADVNKLNNISTLRRAGFSIAQIKALDEGGESAEAVLREFIAEKRTQHELDGKILDALDEFVSCGKEASLDNVAEGIADKASGEVPNSDLKERPGDTVKRVLTVIFASVAICAASLEIIYSGYYYMSEFYHPSYSGETLTLIMSLTAPVMVILSVLMLNVRFGLLRRKLKKGGRISLTIILSVLISLSMVIMPVRLILMWAFPCVSSATTDPDDYTEFDTWVITETKGEILKLFPTEIPSIAMNDEGTADIEYYYNYKGGIGACADIYARWTMEKRSEFNKEKKRIDNYANSNDAQAFDKGTSHIYSFESEEGANGLFMVAYDTATRTVSYGYYYDTSEGVFMFGEYSIPLVNSYMGKVYFEE